MRAYGAGVLLHRPVPDDPALSSHDRAQLTSALVRAGVRTGAAQLAAGKALAHAFRGRRELAPAWSDAALSRLGIGAAARAALLRFDPRPTLTVTERARASDGTTRMLLRTLDQRLVESVLIPGPSRTTLCISSQVGCARACTFCETGALGLTRQLSAAEIVDQVRLGAAELASDAPPLDNLVLMGMGEPFDNLTEVLRALALLTDDRAFAFAPSRVTVSTVGVVDKLPEFFAGTRAELAVSINAPDDARRNRIMPINRRVPLSALREALASALPAGRRVLLEYVLFDHFNDAPEDADLLAAWARGLRCRINVIPANPGPDPSLLPPSSERLAAFVSRLSSHGMTTLVRRPRGRDVGGACGQLAGARRLQVL
jgi:23S rRNA (adenine2503-C2)-methyltransferase